MRSEHLGGKVVLYGGDCLEVMATLPENSVDSVICDPPYHLTSIVKRFGGDMPPRTEATVGKHAYGRHAAGFMGRIWDGGDIAFRPETWAAALRVLKPGGYILAFASTRGFGRMSVAIEDAGFITHPMIAWIFGTGFPKATRVDADGYEGFRYGGQALKPAIEPIYMGQKPFSEKTGTANIVRWGTGALNVDGCRVGTEVTTTVRNGDSGGNGAYGRDERVFTRENPPGRWPANIVHDGSDEVVACFPETTSGAMVRDVPAYDGESTTGFLRGSSGPQNQRADSGSATRFFAAFPSQENNECLSTLSANDAESDLEVQSEHVASALNLAVAQSTGRLALTSIAYPEPSTSVTLSELRLISATVIELIQSLERRFSLGLPPENITTTISHVQAAATRKPTDTTTITISRSKSNGFAVLVTFDITPLSLELGAKDSASAQRRLFYSAKADKNDRIGSKHPTVKPVDLMQWLCRLVTPPGGTVLDPFAGSGSTGEAAWREGFNAILIEREEEYLADIAERLRLADKGPIERRKRAIKQADGAGPLFGDNDNQLGGGQADLRPLRRPGRTIGPIGLKR